MLDDNERLTNEINTWKKKYYAALEQVEEKEKETAHVESQLRHSLSQLSLSIDGIDDKVDTLLQKLRSDIRSGRKVRILAQTIEKIDEAGAKLVKQRQQQNSTPAPHEVLHTVLQQLTWPDTLQKQKKALLKHLNSKEVEQQMDATLDGIVQLLNQALTQTSTETEGKPATTTGFFSKLFNKKGAEQTEDELEKPHVTTAEQQPKASPETSPNEGHQEPPPPCTDNNRQLLREFLKLLKVPAPLEAQFNTLKQRLQASHDDSDMAAVIQELATLVSALAQHQLENKEPPCDNATQGVLLQLLDRIILPDEFKSSLDEIRQQIEQHFVESDINMVLESLAGLITRSQSISNKEKKDLEGFLQQITSTLAEIDTHIRGNQAHQQQSLDDEEKLNIAVEDQVQQIQESVKSATNLGELKGAIQTRLENIRDHLKDFRIGSEERNQLMEQAMTSLVHKVTLMESESAQLKEHLDQQREQALRDPLTGIHNRQAYDDHLALEYSRWKRNQGSLTIVVWDIDHFKRVNDEFGHQAGDKCLKIVATMLQHRLRESDYIARYGGEEFVTLMPDTKVEDALMVANQIREAIAKSDFHYNKLKVPVTISCGLAQFRGNDEPEQVFKRADDALYLAKDRGRNRCMSEGDLK